MKLLQIVAIAASSLAGAISGTYAHTAPTGRYVEVVLQVYFQGETSTDHPISPSAFSAAASEMQDYFTKLSHNNLSIEFRFATVHLSQSYASYLSSSDANIARDAAAIALAANPHILDGATAVSLLTKNAGDMFMGFGQQYTLPGLYPLVSGTRQFAVSVIRDFQLGAEVPTPGTSGVAWSGWAHEFGHQFQMVAGISTGGWLGHPTGYSSGFNLMDSCYPCGESGYGLTDDSHSADGRGVFPGWIDSSRIVSLRDPVSGAYSSDNRTITLPPLNALDTPSGTPTVLRIPVPDNSTYIVDVRTRVGADAIRADTLNPRVVDQGVQISLADPAGTYPLTECVRDLDARTCTKSGPTGDAWPHHFWHPGDTFVDAERALQIEVVSVAPRGYVVRAYRNSSTPHPNLYLTPSLIPPDYSAGSPDIWVDSSCNGWESDHPLRYGRAPNGTVIGTGDDPCANHPNRIYFTVHNIGSAPSAATTASITVAIGGHESTLPSVAVPIIRANDSWTGFGLWQAHVSNADAVLMDDHYALSGLIAVNIVPVPGEMTINDNEATEQLSYFEIDQAGPYVGELYYDLFPRYEPDSWPEGKISDRIEFVSQSRLPKNLKFDFNNGISQAAAKPGAGLSIPFKIFAKDTSPGQLFTVNTIVYAPRYILDHGSKHFSWYRIGTLDFIAHTVITTSLKIDMQQLKAGVIVSGALNPAIPNSAVMVDVSDTAGNGSSLLGSVEKDGTFKLDFQRLKFKPTKAVAIWQGDLIYKGAAARTELKP